MDFISFIPGVAYPLYESKTFNQDISSIQVNFRLLDKQFEKQNNGNFVLMPLYPYHPHEELKDDLDEIYEDSNNNEVYDFGEPFVDENGDNKWNDYELAN